jgi:hypothetical protein
VLAIVVFNSWSVSQQSATAQSKPHPAPNPLRNAYFGDLHVHTSYSLDAYSLGNHNDPRWAYRYGRGEAVTLPGGVKSQLRTPLDFMAITDHDIWLGELSLCLDPSDASYNSSACRILRNDNDQQHISEAWDFYLGMITSLAESNPTKRSLEICGSSLPDEHNRCFQRAESSWQQIQKIAEEFYEPGKFTTFIGFEWTASFKRYGQLHRNVIFRGKKVPDSILSAIDLNNTPERLWQWLEKDCTGDCQALSIPHNTNIGWGRALDAKNSDGTPFTAEILRRRAKTEPLIEIFQAKGSSECSPGLGTNDEQCNFEQLFKPCMPGETSLCAVGRDYVRNAMKTGLIVEQQYEVNPFKYGFIGSTDTHSSTPGATEKDNFSGVDGLGSTLKSRSPEKFLRQYLRLNPGGLAGVWAQENTRESIFDALKRRESFATSGTRIRVRFFGSWSYPSDLHRRHDLLEEAYKNGVPMGGDLPAKHADAKEPRFMVWATKDSNSADLQKIQIIKGWAEGDQTYEQIYDVVCSGRHKPDAKTHRCADNGANVNLVDCSYSKNKGSPELSTTWTDPDFSPADRSFYYVRVLENPTCRWSTYDAIALKVKPPDPPVIQERAWSSPIWYTPGR